MMYRVRQVTVLVASLLCAACAATPGKVWEDKPVDEINNRQGLALKGYDPVAYFTDGKPIEGSPAINYQWHGATYRFTTAEHRDVFMANPERYAPQFGGYCAFAVSRGTTADGDPFQWAVVDKKLYVNNNAIAAKLWSQDRLGNIKAGSTNWPLIPKRPLAPEPSAGVPAEGSGSNPAKVTNKLNNL
jgi:YHS domain-containing protein